MAAPTCADNPSDTSLTSAHDSETSYLEIFTRAEARWVLGLHLQLGLTFVFIFHTQSPKEVTKCNPEEFSHASTPRGLWGEKGGQERNAKVRNQQPTAAVP